MLLFFFPYSLALAKEQTTKEREKHGTKFTKTVWGDLSNVSYNRIQTTVTHDDITDERKAHLPKPP